MNKFCGGARFTAEGEDYYRCLQDMRFYVVSDTNPAGDGDTCIYCKRPIQATDLGVLYVDRLYVKSVHLPQYLRREGVTVQLASRKLQ